MTFCDSPEMPENTKSRLLELIKRHGSITAQELSSHLEVSVPATRRHLCDLQSQGMIEMQVERPSGRGRPQHVFALTDQGESQFSKTYSTLCLDVLRHVEQLYGEGAILKVFNSRNTEMATKLREELPTSMTFGERLSHLQKKLNEMGFDAEIEQQDGVWYLTQRNCPNVLIARQYKSLCESELKMYSEILGVALVRESHIVGGHGICRYRMIL